MDLGIKDRNYLILGASSGFGYEVAKRVAEEGGKPVLVARSEEKLHSFCKKYAGADYIIADLFGEDGVRKISEKSKNTELSGILINAGGPPAGSFPMDKMSRWDTAYREVLRWKIDLLQEFLPRFKAQNFGRLVLVESISVKEPLNGMILSNVFRAAVQALMKSIVNEMKGYDITLNLLAPGYHKTSRLENLIRKKSEEIGQDVYVVETGFAANTPLQRLGDPASFAQLATWLLSPENQYVNGQSFVIDGGMNKSI